jgi:hypothetical protein
LYMGASGGRKGTMTPPPQVSYHQHPPRERQRGFFTP